MNGALEALYEQFRGIRTLCTGIMGYLAMLNEGDFKGGEQPIVANLQRAAAKVAQELDELRDSATRVPRGLGPKVDNAVAVILASEPEIRLPIQVLASHLASAVPGLPTSHWSEDLRLSQQVVRGVAKMNDALKAAHSANRSSDPTTATTEA